MAGQSKANQQLLPHDRVSELVRTYGRNDRVKVPLKKLAVGAINRGISWKYVQTMISRILHDEGFSTERYKYCIAVEPNPKDPWASTKRHMEEAAAADGYLPTVDNLPLLGLLTKNHLFLALLCLLDGHIKKKRLRPDTDLDSPGG